MAIEKYTTEAFIISMYESGEDDIVFKAYTRDFGMILVRSTSLRKSIKLRGHIRVNHMSQITVVQGKEIYRLTGAVEIQNQNKFIAHVCECIGKFIHGEGKNVKLFDRLVQYSNLGNDFDMQQLRISLFAEVLIQLGYLDIENLSLTKEEYINSDINHFYLLSSLNKKVFVNTIQKSIVESML